MTEIKAITVGLLITAACVVLFTRPAGYRTCGHNQHPFAWLSPWRATHCCIAGSIVSALGRLYGAQEMYHQDHGSYATSVSELTNDYLTTFDVSVFDLRVSSNEWSCLVPRSENLPGSYLLRSDGRLYFTERGLPTTNSTLLRDDRTGFSIGLNAQ